MSGDVAQFDPTNRFTTRAADYVRYRPRYPAVLLDTLEAEGGFAPGQTVADIGSGTGFSAEMFLERGYRVLGVEPNTAMRSAGERVLARFAAFTSVDGTAEATALPAGSVDTLIAGQALHWFDLDRTRPEFARILRGPGPMAFFWNTRRADLSPFMAAYEALLTDVSSDYAQVHHRRIDAEALAPLFDNRRFTYRTFPYSQSLDLEGLVGRTFSASYAPAPDDPRADALRAALAALFARFERNGAIQYDYTTELYFGRISR